MRTRNLRRNLYLRFICLMCLAQYGPVSPAWAQSGQVTRVSFKKDKFNRVFLPAKINRDSVMLLFGNYPKTLSLAPYFLQSRALYPNWGSVTLTGKNGRQRDKRLFTLPKIEVGNLRFRNLDAIINIAFPDSIPTGTTGSPMLGGYNWKIDYDHTEVLIAKSPFSAKQVFTTITYQQEAYPAVVISLAGINSEFIVDLGSGAGLLVNTGSALGRAVLEQYDIEPSRTVITSYRGRQLVDTVYEVNVPSLVFNGIKLRAQKVRLSSAAAHNLVGTAFLSNYNVILNNSRKKKVPNELILEKRRQH